MNTSGRLQRAGTANAGIGPHQRPLNVLSIDVEDYFHVSAFAESIDYRKWDDYDCRVESNTYRLLELLAAHGIKATFFVLGWVADRFPELVRDIYDEGHEIGSHSYWHRLVYRLTPTAFRADLLRSRTAIEQVIGDAVTAYRAPSFSITRESLWALEILAEEGFEADSSIFPVRHDRYGMPDAPPCLHRWRTRAGTIWEAPPSVYQLGTFNLPVSGGGYFRLYPLSVTLHALKEINEQSRYPFVFYVHPWEIDPQQPRLQVGSRQSRLRHYLNLHSTWEKLDHLLAVFPFGTLSDLIRSSGQLISEHDPGRRGPPASAAEHSIAISGVSDPFPSTSGIELVAP